MSKRQRLSEWYADEKDSCQSENIPMSQLLKTEGVGAADTADMCTSQYPYQPPEWYSQLHAQFTALKTKKALSDAQWWSSLPTGLSPYSEYLVDECLVLSTELLLLRSGNVRIWLNTMWLREQHRNRMSLHLVHASFSGIAHDQLVTHLVDLLKTVGCQIRLYNSNAIGQNVVCRNFTITHR
ncbi:hypothetical protein PSACC_02663 [Paramicrosporidium saccamoebae]|uniref:Uncharacterized protein n=1 Tax=Paramicrosporidium saccamoebae TaxID=1246581 RepID=A0A2H9TIL0_9FUNG|nr:hypothetical protein PSACC_02663 [Paramicrosporidium saccamoebae]